MGYNFFNIKEVTGVFLRKLHEFRSSLGAAVSKGKDITFAEEGNFVTVTTKAYFDVLYATENKVYAKSQVFSAVFKRRTDIPVNLSFSMTRIECPSCGASFDATKNKNCPYCGSKYEITTDDWALVELKSIQ